MFPSIESSSLPNESTFHGQHSQNDTCQWKLKDQKCHLEQILYAYRDSKYVCQTSRSVHSQKIAVMRHVDLLNEAVRQKSSEYFKLELSTNSLYKVMLNELDRIIKIKQIRVFTAVVYRNFRVIAPTETGGFFRIIKHYMFGGIMDGLDFGTHFHCHHVFL